MAVDFDHRRPLLGGVSRGRRKKREKKIENLEIRRRSPSTIPNRRRGEKKPRRGFVGRVSFDGRWEKKRECEASTMLSRLRRARKLLAEASRGCFFSSRGLLKEKKRFLTWEE
ncbi:hypothetical protein GW17_00019591 [Ensete ventricosum]|nr:hypothetical protein GW17_00019591 [Ensete ventricosum]